MNISAEVEPTEYVSDVKIIHSIRMNIFNIILFKSVTVVATLCDDKDYVIDNKHIVIEGEEYANWSNDDSYLIDLVLAKLQLTKKVIDVPIDSDTPL